MDGVDSGGKAWGAPNEVWAAARTGEGHFQPVLELALPANELGNRNHRLGRSLRRSDELDFVTTHIAPCRRRRRRRSLGWLLRVGGRIDPHWTCRGVSPQ